MPGSSEVAWIEVAHSCFRVFHGQNCVQNRFLSPKDPLGTLVTRDGPLDRTPKAPDDQFLKDFHQLETHLKQLSASSSSTASIALQSECMIFFVRFLNTLDAFTWPDFLAVVSTKLAEQFVNCDSNAIRKTILQVFQRANGQVNQLSDGNKLLSHLANALSSHQDATARALAWGIVETIPVLCADQKQLHQLLLSALASFEPTERCAASKAALAIALVSPSFRELVLAQLMPNSSDQSDLLHGQQLKYSALVARSVASMYQAQQVYCQYQRLYADMVAVDDESACSCLRTLTDVAIKFHNVHPHVLFLKEVVQSEEPRPLVLQTAYEQLQRIASTKESQVSSTLKLSVLQTVYGILSHALDRTDVQSPNRRSRSLLRIRWVQLELLRCCAHQTSDGWNSTDEANARQVVSALQDCVALAKKLVAEANTPRYDRLFVMTLMECAMNQVTAFSAHEKNNGGSAVFSHAKSCGFLVQLLVNLHPQRFEKDVVVWEQALSCMEQLCQAHPNVVPRLTVGFLMEIVEFAAEDPALTTYSPAFLEDLLVLVSHIMPFCVHGMLKSLSMFEQLLDRCDPSRLRTRKALVVIILRLWRTLMFQDPTQVREQVVTGLRGLGPAERYDLAKEAMAHGFARLAHKLLSDFESCGFDNECFTHWWQFLSMVSRAEARVVNLQGVDLEVVNSLAQAKIRLKASSTSAFRFDFQRAWLLLRADFVGLLLQLQQLMVEVVCLNETDFIKHRVEGVVKTLQQLADQYRQLEMTLFGRQELDIELVGVHKRVFWLLIQALQGFILEEDWTAAARNYEVTCQHRERLDALAPMSPLLAMESLIHQELNQKLEQFRTTSDEYRTAFGGEAVLQLVRSLCAIPVQMPRLFFIQRVPQKINANVQFLTFAERFSFPSKPRGRSQLGVSLGTAFTSFIKGVVECEDLAVALQKRVRSIELRIELTRSESNNGKEVAASWPLQGRKTCHQNYSTTKEIAVQLGSDSDVDHPQRIPFETTLHIDAKYLHTKGSYSLTGQVVLVDAEQPSRRWMLQQPTAHFSRGLIVY